MDSKKCEINLKPDKKQGFIIEVRGACKPLLTAINEKQGPYSQKVFNRRIVTVVGKAPMQQSEDSST